MYKCNFPDCGKECKTIQGLLSHKRLKHGIIKKKAAVQDEIERKLATEELIVQPEEYYEDSRETHLRVEKESLEREKRELQNRLMEYEEPEIKHIQNEVDGIRERIYRSSEENVNERKVEKNSEMSPAFPAFPPLPHPPPLPPPLFAETINERIKRLNERELLR